MAPGATEPGATGDEGTVVRNNAATRWFHAATVAVTAVLLATGWWLRAGREGRPSLIARVLDAPDTEVHRWAGWLLVAVLAAGVTLGVRGRSPARRCASTGATPAGSSAGRAAP